MLYFARDSGKILHGCQAEEIEKNYSEEPGESFKDNLYNRVYNEREWCPGYEIGDTSIQYKLNKRGYRAPEFEELDYTKYRIACYGCSYTFGVGVKNEDTWPEQLRASQEIPNGAQIWNLGLPGASNDLITRYIVNTAAVIQPHIMFVQWTIPHRREWVDGDGRIKKILTNHPKFWMDNTNAYRSFMTLSNEKWDDYCFEKNLTLIRLLCELHGVILISSHIQHFPMEESARDNVHPGKKDHKAFAKLMFNNLVDETVFPDNRDIVKERYGNIDSEQS